MNSRRRTRRTHLGHGAGLRVTPFPVDFRQDTARRFTLLDLIPSARALAETETALREVIGRVAYRVGW
jgi:hypothetical protein